MNNDAKKTVLRMIPYGIYVLTSDDGKGNIAAATVNWVTQTAFAPPLVVAGVKTDSGAYKAIQQARTFALNMLGKDQKSLAFTFFRPADVKDGKISGKIAKDIFPQMAESGASAEEIVAKQGLSHPNRSKNVPHTTSNCWADQSSPGIEVRRVPVIPAGNVNWY